MQILQMSDTLMWLIILVVMLFIELSTWGLTTIWFAGGSLTALLVSLCGGGITLQIALFFIVSLVLLIFTRPIAVKVLMKKRVATNADSLIGAEAVVIEAIDNLNSKGAVKIRGQEWTARSEGDTPVEKGETVSVLRIDGVKLIVQRKGEEK